VTDVAADAGASPLELAVLRGKIALGASDLAAAENAWTAGVKLAPQDPRLAWIKAECLLRDGSANAPAAALAVIEKGLDSTPGDLDLQRKRIEIVSRFERWTVADRAIVGFKQALSETGQSLAEANLAAADIYRRLGRVREEMTEYGIATSADPTNLTVWRQFAASAEARRHYTLARDANAAILRLDPNDKNASASLRRIDEERASAATSRAPSLLHRRAPTEETAPPAR
jgi:tetratricopeptide (TPR) repeat protein